MKFLSCITALLLSTLVFSQTPDFSMMGFATLNGGTTGGEGGEVVTATTFDELNAYCTAAQLYVILIDGEIKGSNPDSLDPGAPVRRVIKMTSNKTLLGVGSDAFINQINLDINSKHNIIIRNIRFTMTDVPVDGSGSEVKILGTNTDPDIISISADLSSIPANERMTRNIWIDHCEFYNEDPAVMTDQDRYDGLVDIKNDVQYVTISWCVFRDHHKGCLSGSGNSDNFDRKTTMHHNLFDNIISRTPLQRYGKLHLLNNYVVNCENGLNVRIQSEAVAEKNYFKDTKKPIFGKESEGGTAREIENYFDNCTRLSWVHIPSTTSPDADPLNTSEEYNSNTYEIPYTYESYVDDVLDVPGIVTEWAGIGKISEDPTSNVTVHETNALQVIFSPTLVTDILHLTISSARNVTANITVTDTQGKTYITNKPSFITGENHQDIDLSNLPDGIYICRVETGNAVVSGKVSKIVRE